MQKVHLVVQHQEKHSDGCSQHLYGFKGPLLTVLIGFALFALPMNVLAGNSMEDVFKHLRMTEDQKKDFLQHKVITFSDEKVSDRDIPVGMVGLFEGSAEEAIQIFREAQQFKAVSIMKGFGKIDGAGTPGDFSGAVLTPNGPKEADRYLIAEPGADLNLSPKEITAFQDLNKSLKDSDNRQKKVEELLHKTLLARYQAYRAGGVSSIAPFDRGDGDLFQPGAELEKTMQGSDWLKTRFPTFYKFLLNYPSEKLSGVDDQFFWVNFDVLGRPNFALTHRTSFQDGDKYVFFERHFYTSHDYNTLEQMGVVLPSDEGTVVAFLYRISTDQVAGFGSTVKGAAARKLIEGPLEEVFAEQRKKK